MPCPARHAATVASLLAAPLAHAARPMVTDDATILGPRLCQVEAWTEHHPSDIEYWAAPHCNADGDWELVAGAGELRPTLTRAATSGLLQAKTLFRPLAPNGWGTGLELAAQLGPGGGLFGNVSATGLLSFSLLDDAVRVHLNAGWLRVHAVRTGPTWGVGAEWFASREWGLTLEAFGQGRTYAQAGVRYAALNGRLVLDAALGDRVSMRGKERYVAFGLTFTGLSR